MDSRKLITLENFDREATAGPIVTSPRSLFVCELEGVDPNTDLVMLSRSAALLSSRNDAVAAEKRLQWWRSRRDQLAADLISRRAALIDEQERREGQNGSRSQASDGSHKVETSPPRSHGKGSQPRAKLLNKVEQIELIIKANEEREKRQLAYIVHLKEKHEMYEEEKILEKERRDEQFRIAQAIQRKRDLDERDRMLRREQGELAEDERARLFQIERQREIEEEDTIRQQRLLQRKADLLARKRERQREQRLKQEFFSQQAASQHAEAMAKGRDRLEREQQRLEALELEKKAAIEEKRREHERRMEESKRKKEAADAARAEKAKRTLEHIEATNAALVTREFEASRHRIENLVENDRKEKEREAAWARATELAAARAKEVAQKIEDEALRLSQWQAKLDSDRCLRRVNKELTMGDKLALVARTQRQQEHALKMAERKAAEKIKRIEALREEQKRLEEERLQLQHEMERVKASVSVPLSATTPGPQDYDVLDSEQKLLPNSPIVRIGASRRPKQFQKSTPGPGQYFLPPARKNRGAVLPPWGGDTIKSPSK